jgi:hypothetical protein
MQQSLLQRPKDYFKQYTDAQGQYSIDADPLFNGSFSPGNQGGELHSICHYQCDHLGTPMELTNVQMPCPRQSPAPRAVSEVPTVAKLCIKANLRGGLIV